LRVAELSADRRAPEPAPELLTVAQAAELAGVSVKTVRSWLSNGRLTRHGPPRHPVVARSELLALLAGPPRSRTLRRARTPKRGQPAGTFTGLAREGSYCPLSMLSGITSGILSSITHSAREN
jgi:excisionase family DNA binding protein